MLAEDDMSRFGNEHPVDEIWDMRCFSRHLIQQNTRIDDHTVADDRPRSGHGPRGQHPKLVFDAIDEDRVPCVRSALASSAGIDTLRQDCRNLTLSFVTPL